jgi:uncharacterized membrane protein YbhN (UPF0104 family)
MGELGFQPDYTYLFVSLIVLLLAWIATVWSLQRIFEALNYHIPFSDVYTIYFRSIAGKYLPGKLWQIAGSTYLAAKRGIPEGISVTSFVVGQAYWILSGIVLIGCVAAVGIFKGPTDFLSSLKWTFIPVIIGIIFIAFKPKLIGIPMNWILRLLKRKRVDIDIKFGVGIKILLYYLVCWSVFGLAFWFFVSSLTPISFDRYLILTAAFSAAIIIGFLSLFTPGGIGVREGILILLLTYTNDFQAPLPAIIALGFRLVMTISEIISFGLTWVMRPGSNRRRFNRQ